MFKLCSKCKIEKDVSEFYIIKSKNNSLSSYCKSCQREYDKQRQKQRKEYLKQNWSKYYQENKEAIALKGKQYYQENKKYLNELNRKIYQENKAKINAKRYEKYHNIPQYRLNLLMSSNIYFALRTSKSEQHWEDLVGYSIEQLHEHLESQFTSEMNWDNMGSYWEIDHIIPRNLFTYSSSNDKEFQICWSLMNLRPLSMTENRSRPKDGRDIPESLKQQILSQNI